MEATENQQFLNESYIISRSPAIDIEFQDLSYSLRRGNRKKILQSLSGKFRSGELTAILGASGSGKTTLLQILAGYLSDGVTGKININGRARQMKHFHKISAYIMQDDLLQPYLTLQEAITVAAKLKLGVSVQKRRVIIKEVLNLFGLENCTETRMENLSGGEKKRLSIALEMINNPPVILLDEPTSGLDTVAVKQCVKVLRKLTEQGRTIICTIHQPSPTIFQQFDQAYFITNGLCIYNGSPSNMIPFLSSVELDCPTTHSPAEYIIETAQLDDEYLSILVEGIQNGKTNKTESEPSTEIAANTNENNPLLENDFNTDFATSFWTQLYIIFRRMMLQLRRNKVAIAIQLFHHMFVGVLLGLVNLGIGNNAESAVVNFKFCMVLTFFFLFTHLMTLVLLFPLEVVVVKREYFNRWYSLKAYFIAMTLRSLPLMIVLGSIFIIITYIMTNQPLELERFIKLSVSCGLVAICSESLGLTVGTLFSITNGSIVALALCAPGVFFAIYGMGFGETIGAVMKFFMNINYLRCGLVAAVKALFDDRPPLECNEIYCYYAYPNRLLKDFGMLDSSYTYNILVLVISYVLFRLIAFLALRYRLTSNTIESLRWWSVDGITSK